MGKKIVLMEKNREGKIRRGKMGKIKKVDGNDEGLGSLKKGNKVKKCGFEGEDR